MALAFSGNTHRVEVADDTSWTDGDYLTILTWVYLSSLGVSKTICNSTSTDRIRLETTYNNEDMLTFTTFAAANGWEVNSSDAVLSTNTWHCIAIAADFTVANKIYLYLGGLGTPLADDSNNSAGATGTQATDGPLYVGNFDDDESRYWPGNIAVFMLWREYLTLAELQRYQFNPRADRSSLKIFYHLGLQGASTCADLSGTGNNGTIYGASTAEHVPLGPPFAHKTSPLSEYSAAVLKTRTVGVDADLYHMLGWAWGESDTSHAEIPDVWDTWRFGNGDPADFDSSFGRLQLKAGGEKVYSEVKDMGSAENRMLTLTVDKYDTGIGTPGTVEWRGSTTSFVWDGSPPPDWEVYPAGGAAKNWRYVQVRVGG